MNGDLISRSGLLKKIRAYADSKVTNEGVETANNILKTVQVIEKMPAIDAAPVVHGRWEDKGYITTAYGSIETGCCPVYGAVDVPIEPYDYYCLNCGAKMDLEE